MTYQNKRKKGTKPMEKELAQSDITVRRKDPKTTQNVNFFQKKKQFCGFFPNWYLRLSQFFYHWLSALLALVLICHSIGLQKIWFLTPNPPGVKLTCLGPNNWFLRRSIQNCPISRGITLIINRTCGPPGVWKFENPHYRVKNQSCRKLYIWVSKPIRRKIQNQWKKN